MNRRHLMQKLSRAALALGATTLLPNCATTASGGSRVSATKENPFVNSLGMKFVPVPGTQVLFCTTETTVSQYQAAGMGYESPRFPQSGNHPAVNVSWNEATTWCAWLSKREGRRYRLPTKAEWTAAVGRSKYPWGSGWPPPPDAGNYAGEEMLACTPEERRILGEGVLKGNKFSLIKGFRDRYKFTAPVGSYAPNAYGIHDLGGNVEEWCQDWYDGKKAKRVSCGSSWGFYGFPEFLLSCISIPYAPENRDHELGFRCVLVMSGG